MHSIGALLFTILLSANLCVPQPSLLCGQLEGVMYRGICYFLSNKQTSSFSDATSSCIAQKGSGLANLADISTRRYVREKLLAPRQASSLWVGLRVRQTPWQWVEQSKDNKILKGQGCYASDKVEFSKQGLSDALTTKRCEERCIDSKLSYAGFEFGSSCYCGHALPDGVSHSSSCELQCSGDMREMCGGAFRTYINHVRGAYSNWLPGRPYSDGNCAAMVASKDFRWKDEDCSRKNRFVCRASYWNRNDFLKPGSGWRGNCSSTYDCFFVSEKKENWLAARLACLSKGGDLARFDKSTHWKMLQILIQERAFRSKFWIGVARRQLIWENGSPFHTYTELSGATSNILKQQACFQLIISDSRYQWKPMSCSEASPRPRALLCERIIHSVDDASAVSSDENSTTTTYMYVGIGVAGYLLLMIICIILICACAPAKKKSRSSSVDKPPKEKKQKKKKKSKKDKKAKHFETVEEISVHDNGYYEGDGQYNNHGYRREGSDHFSDHGNEPYHHDRDYQRDSPNHEYWNDRSTIRSSERGNVEIISDAASNSKRHSKRSYEVPDVIIEDRPPDRDRHDNFAY